MRGMLAADTRFHGEAVMQNHSDLHQSVGKRGHYWHKQAYFEVEVLDARQRWGVTDVLVTPVAGHGSFWVELRGVHLFQASEMTQTRK